MIAVFHPNKQIYTKYWVEHVNQSSSDYSKYQISISHFHTVGAPQKISLLFRLVRLLPLVLLILFAVGGVRLVVVCVVLVGDGANRKTLTTTKYTDALIHTHAHTHKMYSVNFRNSIWVANF